MRKRVGQKVLREQLENEIREKTRDLADKLIKTGGAKSQLVWQIRKRITNTKAKETYDAITEEGEILEDPTKTKNYIAETMKLPSVVNQHVSSLISPHYPLHLLGPV